MVFNPGIQTISHSKERLNGDCLGSERWVIGYRNHHRAGDNQEHIGRPWATYQGRVRKIQLVLFSSIRAWTELWAYITVRLGTILSDSTGLHPGVHPVPRVVSPDRN